MTGKAKKCSYWIFSGERGDMAGHPCSLRGVVTAGGKLFCHVHDPEAVAARREKRAKRYKVEQAAMIRAARRERAAYDALDVKLPAAKDRIEELTGTLRYALKCIKYCRAKHPDAQKGDGLPVEAVIDEVLSRA